MKEWNSNKYRFDLPGAFIGTKSGKVYGTLDTSLWDALPDYKKRYHLLMGTKNEFIFIKPFELKDGVTESDILTNTK